MATWLREGAARHFSKRETPPNHYPCKLKAFWPPSIKTGVTESSDDVFQNGNSRSIPKPIRGAWTFSKILPKTIRAEFNTGVIVFLTFWERLRIFLLTGLPKMCKTKNNNKSFHNSFVGPR